MATILATTVPERSVSIILTCLMLIGAILALCVGVWLVRRWQRGPRADASAPWNLEDLRKLRAQGKLTEVEYEALRGEIIGALTRKPAPDGASAAPRPKSQQERDEPWDWVAPDDPRSSGFDVKKQSPD